MATTFPTPSPFQDVRLVAHALGLRCASLSHAYRLLEAGDPDAEKVFTALTHEKAQPSASNTWGTLAALTAGLNRDRISVEVRV